MHKSIAMGSLGLFLVGFALPIQGQEKANEVALQVVKYDGLKQAVLKNRGKVVLVDFWDTL